MLEILSSLTFWKQIERLLFYWLLFCWNWRLSLISHHTVDNNATISRLEYSFTFEQIIFDFKSRIVNSFYIFLDFSRFVFVLLGSFYLRNDNQQMMQVKWSKLFILPWFFSFIFGRKKYESMKEKRFCCVFYSQKHFLKIFWKKNDLII